MGGIGLATQAATKTKIKIKYWFDEDAADRAVEFFSTFLKHTLAEGRCHPTFVRLEEA